MKLSQINQEKAVILNNLFVSFFCSEISKLHVIDINMPLLITTPWKVNKNFKTEKAHSAVEEAELELGLLIFPMAILVGKLVWLLSLWLISYEKCTSQWWSQQEFMIMQIISWIKWQHIVNGEGIELFDTHRLILTKLC